MEELYNEIVKTEDEVRKLHEDKLITRRKQIVVDNRVLNKEMRIKELNQELSALKYNFEKEKVLKLMDYTVPIVNLLLSIIYFFIIGLIIGIRGIIIGNVLKGIFLMYMVTLGMGVVIGCYTAYKIKNKEKVYNFLLNKYPEFNLLIEKIKNIGEEINSDNISLEKIVNNQNKINSKMEDYDKLIDMKQVSLEMLYDRIKDKIINSNLNSRNLRREKVFVKKKVR